MTTETEKRALEDDTVESKRIKYDKGIAPIKPAGTEQKERYETAT